MEKLSDYNSGKVMAYREFVLREEAFVRAPYNPEAEFYSYVVSGDLNKVEELTRESLLAKEAGWGRLSKNMLQNIKYHFVITTAVIARRCIDGGMELQMAYNLSDYYIRLADDAKSPEEVAELHPVMCRDYTKRMRDIQKNNVYSAQIIKCINYIYDNLHTRITIKQLTEVTGLSTGYLSRLFKKEIGLAVSDYILDKKIETASNMLRYSEYSIAEIASVMAFPSQSYFSSVFKKKKGVTPFEYRKQ